MRKVIGIVVVIVIVLGLKFYNRSSDDKEVLADMKTLVTQIAPSPAESTYLTGIVDREHKRVFDAAYDMGGRRRAAKLDEDKYIDGMFKAMIEQCKKDKKKELAVTLYRAQQAILKEEPAK